MGTQSIRLAKTIRQLQNVRDLQKSFTLTKDEYMVGMFNGLELALSILTGKNPDYIDCNPTSAPPNGELIPTPVPIVPYLGGIDLASYGINTNVDTEEELCQLPQTQKITLPLSKRKKRS